MVQRSFVQGAMLLAGAAMISKLLGSVYTIILQNIIGDHGMGLFQMAYPIYATLLAIATAGFPVAISKLVAERLAKSDESGARQTFRVASSILSIGGIVCFAVLYFGAPMWAAIAGDIQAAPAIRAIAPALLIVPMMSVIRGYFQGYQWMEPTAASQVVEQFVRVATIIGLAVYLTNHGYSQSISAAGAAFGAVTGAAAGMLLLLYFWKRRPQPRTEQIPERLGQWATAKQLLYYAFPISLGALVVPLMNNVDVVTVVNLLKSQGEGQSLATTQFGLLSGRAYKLMMLPTTLAAGIGIAVMPAISEAFTLGFRKLMEDRVDMAVRLTTLLSLPAAMGLYFLATPVDIALFKDAAGSTTIQIMAIATVFASLQTTWAAILQGAGWVYLPVFNLLLAAGVKLIGNLWLVPKHGIAGAAVATVLSYATAAILNLIAIRKYLHLSFRFRHWLLRPLIATFIMSAMVYAMARQWVLWGGLNSSRLLVGFGCCIIITCGMGVYFVALIVSGAISKSEIGAIPVVGSRLVALCSRIGLMR